MAKPPQAPTLPYLLRFGDEGIGPHLAHVAPIEGWCEREQDQSLTSATRLRQGWLRRWWLVHSLR